MKMPKIVKIMIGISLIPIVSVMLFVGSAVVVGVYEGITGSGTVEQEEIDNLKNQVTKLQQENKALETENSSLESKNKTLQEKVDEASPWFEMKEEERKAEEERLAKEKAEREEAERKAKEEAEAKAKAEAEAKEKEEQERLAKEQAEAEAKEKQGYETGITYSQLARTPDEYDGEKVKFRGKVIQVMESGSLVIMRLAVNGSYDNVMYLTTVSSKLNGERILEDDYITVYGISKGIHTYTSTLGASISIPSMYVEKIDR